MRMEILARQAAAMKEHGLDAMISCSPENFAYAAGFVVPSQPLIRHRHAMAIVTADSKPAILAVDMEATTLRSREPDTRTEIWQEFTDDSMAVLARLLKEMGLERSVIGIEMDYLPAGDMARLLGYLPGARFKSDEAILARLRQIKTKDEIALLRRLSLISDQAITDALRSVRVGSSEMDIAAALTRNVYTLGAEHFKLMIVATGERSQLPNVGPSQRRLQAQDVCRVEIFSVIGGYQAGVCRTAAVQEIPPHAEKIWQNLVACKYLIMDMMKPGASCRTIYDAFIKQLSTLNLPDLLCRPWHRPPSARGSLYRQDAGARQDGRRLARGRDGPRRRAALLSDRIRLRHAEQGHDARDRNRLRAFVELFEHGQGARDPIRIRARMLEEAQNADAD